MVECVIQPKSRSIIVFCVKINLSISVTLREPLLQHTVMVPALRLAFLIYILLGERKGLSEKIYEDTVNRLTSGKSLRLFSYNFGKTLS